MRNVLYDTNGANGLLRVFLGQSVHLRALLPPYPSEPPLRAMHYSCHYCIQIHSYTLFKPALLCLPPHLLRLQSFPVSIERPLHLPPPPLPNILTAYLSLPSIFLPLPHHPSLQHLFRPLLLTHKPPIRTHAPPEISPLLAALPKLPVPVEGGELPPEGGAVECCVEGGTAGDGCGVDVGGGNDGGICGMLEGGGWRRVFGVCLGGARFFEGGEEGAEFSVGGFLTGEGSSRFGKGGVLGGEWGGGFFRGVVLG